MPNGYRIFVSGQYRGLEVAETPEEAVAAYLRDPRRLVPVDKVRAEPWDQRIARYRLTFDAGGHSVSIEVDAFDEGVDDAEYRARRVLRTDMPHLADAPLLGEEKVRVYPMAARILPFPGAERDT